MTKPKKYKMSNTKDSCPKFPRTNENLKNRRNYLIRKRFYELYELENLRYDRAINQLAFDEFFLQETTIGLIIKCKGKWKDDEPFKPERRL